MNALGAGGRTLWFMNSSGRGLGILGMSALLVGACQVPDSSQAFAPDSTVRADRVNRVWYGSGERAWMDIVEPDGSVRGVVAYVHGGSWMAGSAAWTEVHPAVQELASKDTVVASVEYRLVPQIDEGGQVHDVLEAVRFLQDTYGAPIILAGHSAGGHIAALAGLFEPMIAGVVLLAAPGDLSDLAKNPHRVFGYTLSGLVSAALGCSAVDPDGELHCCAAQLREGDILRRLDHTAPPAYIAYGGADEIVLPQYARELAGVWEQAVGFHNVWIDEVETAGHQVQGVNLQALKDFVGGVFAGAIVRSRK